MIFGWVKIFAMIWYVLVCGMYIMRLKQFKLLNVVSALTCCALLHSVCNLKATQMNMQHCLIWELVLYKFELEVTINIVCSWSEYSNLMVQEITFWLQEHEQLGNVSRTKMVDSEAVLYVREVNLEISTERVSGKFGISQ